MPLLTTPPIIRYVAKEAKAPKLKSFAAYFDTKEIFENIV